MNDRAAIVVGCVAMFVAVAAGAFGAHALQHTLAPQALAVWHTAVQYQAWHALALIASGILMAQPAPGNGTLVAQHVPGRGTRGLRITAWLFAAGIVLFSGSLYALALTGERWLGAVTPLGGVAFLAGWLLLAGSVAPAR
ncbi:MAG: DUF423 domain-containing protein [Casimicrobiaceae bacterium]